MQCRPRASRPGSAFWCIYPRVISHSRATSGGGGATAVLNTQQWLLQFWLTRNTVCAPLQTGPSAPLQIPLAGDAFFRDSGFGSRGQGHPPRGGSASEGSPFFRTNAGTPPFPWRSRGLSSSSPEQVHFTGQQDMQCTLPKALVHQTQHEDPGDSSRPPDLPVAPLAHVQLAQGDKHEERGALASGRACARRFRITASGKTSRTGCAPGCRCRFSPNAGAYGRTRR